MFSTTLVGLMTMLVKMRWMQQSSRKLPDKRDGTDGQMDGQTERQTDGQTCMHAHQQMCWDSINRLSGKNQSTCACQDSHLADSPAAHAPFKDMW